LPPWPHTRKEFDDAMSTRGAASTKSSTTPTSRKSSSPKPSRQRAHLWHRQSHRLPEQRCSHSPTRGLQNPPGARRKAVFNVSDESLEEYLAFTQLMIRLINKLDLYKDYRAH